MTERHMPTDGHVSAGATASVDIPLAPEVYDGFLDVGFTRSFASSQAYADKYGNNTKVIPVHFCFSPHTDLDLSLNPVGAAIDQATSSGPQAVLELSGSPPSCVAD